MSAAVVMMTEADVYWVEYSRINIFYINAEPNNPTNGSS